jgi:hypothetical protein
MIHTFVEPPAEYYFQDEAAQPAAQVPAALEKTRMCLYFLQGRCKYTDCSFAHSHDELKQAPSNLRKTKMCELFLAGCCPNEFDCNFAHSMDELKVRSRRSMSSSLSPTSMESHSIPAPTVIPQSQQQQPNSEFCARTILSMLIKMQPEAAVAFLSNPECKIMLERLLDDSKSSSVPATNTPSSSTQSVGILTPQVGGGSFFLDEPTLTSSFTPFDNHPY